MENLWLSRQGTCTLVQNPDQCFAAFSPLGSLWASCTGNLVLLSTQQFVDLRHRGFRLTAPGCFTYFSCNGRRSRASFEKDSTLRETEGLQPIWWCGLPCFEMHEYNGESVAASAGRTSLGVVTLWQNPGPSTTFLLDARLECSGESLASLRGRSPPQVHLKSQL